MRMDRRQVLATTVAASGALIVGRPGVASAADSTDPVPVPLDDLFDNNGIGVAAGDANLDGSGYGFPAAGLPAGAVTVDGVPYRLAASTAAGQNDNVVAWARRSPCRPGSTSPGSCSPPRPTVRQAARSASGPH